MRLRALRVETSPLGSRGSAWASDSERKRRGQPLSAATHADRSYGISRSDRSPSPMSRVSAESMLSIRRDPRSEGALRHRSKRSSDVSDAISVDKRNSTQSTGVPKKTGSQSTNPFPFDRACPRRLLSSRNQVPWYSNPLIRTHSKFKAGRTFLKPPDAPEHAHPPSSTPPF